MKIRPAHTIENIRPYFFASLNNKIEKLRANGVDVIRLDMGSPDLPPADFIIEKLIASARDPNKHGYAPMEGTPTFLHAVASYYENRFNVRLVAESEVVALIGSKEGIFNINHTLLDPGDLVLLPDPFYPVYLAGAQIADCKIYFMPLLKENDFLPNFDTIPSEIANQSRLMWLNYPNNPTGAVADLDFFNRALAFANKHDIIIAHDAPYVDVTFDGYQAHSILEVEGAKETAIEFNSLSKTYNMAGWRVGMAVGNPEIVRLLKVYKSQLDSSMFTPIMDAAVVALTGDQSWLVERNRIYQERRDIVYNALKKADFEVDLPKAALYLWFKLPVGYGDMVTLCDHLLEETGVSITPGIVYGLSGMDYIRISIITPTDRIKEAMDRMLTWFQKQRQ